MEKEEVYSRFIRSVEEVIPADKFWASVGENHSFYRFPDESAGFFGKIYSRSYQLLDSLARTESYVFAGRDIPENYQEIFKLLNEQGLINSIILQEGRYNDAPFFYRYTIRGTYPEGITDGVHPDVHGLGFSKNREMALSKAVGEFLERYFLTLYYKKDLIRASPRSLKEKHRRVLDLALLAGFSEEQKAKNPRRVWNDDSVFFWEKGFRIATGESTHIPAQLVYWNYRLSDEPPEPFLAEGNTNGCGGMFSKEGAILSGLYELIQRDAFLIFWLNSVSPPKIKPESVPDEEFQTILEESKRYGFMVHCLNTTLDTGIPSFVVVLENALVSVGPHLAMGGGCEKNPAQALRRALEEAWSLYHWTRGFAPLSSSEIDETIRSGNINQLKRCLFFANPDMRRHYEFLMAGEEKGFSEFVFDCPDQFPSEKDELDFAVRKVEKLGAGYEVYAYVARHPLLDRLGYFSAQVIVPKFAPLYLNERNALLGSGRIFDVPRKMGLAVGERLNTWPHPFP